jgi:hypothetical protein
VRSPHLPIPHGHFPISRLLAAIIVRKRRRGRKDLEPDGVPVEPNRPNTLSGGAEAPLEFDE